MRKTTIAVSFCVLIATGLKADFRYEETTQLTGGMMKSIGFLARGLREPIRSEVLVKDDRMAWISKDTAHIIDVGKETVTEINFKDKNYSVVTFDEMKQILDKAAQQVRGKSSEGSAEVEFKMDVKETGQTKTIMGLNTKEVILTMTTEVKDKQGGQAGALNTVSVLWLAPDVPGYGEVRALQQRMAAKLAWTPGRSVAAQGAPDSGKRMGEMIKAASKLEGIPVLQVMKMGGIGGTGAEAQPGAAPSPDQPQPEAPKPSEAASEAAAGAATASAGRAGAIAGGIGGMLGGFGRRKKAAPEPPPPPPPQAAPAPDAQKAPPPGAAAGPSLMEMTTQLTAFSSGPVEASRFEIPAGFKQVPHAGLKGLKK